jgi:hypothetical protein
MPIYPEILTSMKQEMVNTQANVSDPQEVQFQQWIRQLPWHKQFIEKYKEEPDLNTPDYDYRKAWKAGIVPELNNYDNAYHWASGYLDPKTNQNVWLKSQNHPTAWMQHFLDKTGKDPQSLGLKTADEGMRWIIDNNLKGSK